MPPRRPTCRPSLATAPGSRLGAAHTRTRCPNAQRYRRSPSSSRLRSACASTMRDQPPSVAPCAPAVPRSGSTSITISSRPAISRSFPVRKPGTATSGQTSRIRYHQRRHAGSRRHSVCRPGGSAPVDLVAWCGRETITSFLASLRGSGEAVSSAASTSLGCVHRVCQRYISSPSATGGAFSLVRCSLQILWCDVVCKLSR
jgi:hypothetical protein